MAKEWQPDAPGLQQDFQQAHSGQKEQEGPQQGTVSGAEAQKLEEERKTARAAHELVPPGATAKAQQQEHPQREERIRYIRERMAAGRERLRKGWELAKK